MRIYQPAVEWEVGALLKGIAAGPRNGNSLSSMARARVYEKVTSFMFY